MSEPQVVDEAAVQSEVLTRHLAWERSMQAAVAQNLDEHRGQDHKVVMLREAKIVSPGPGQY